MDCNREYRSKGDIPFGCTGVGNVGSCACTVCGGGSDVVDVKLKTDDSGWWVDAACNEGGAAGLGN